ncbi:uncharacterized protein K452DRAFT_18085 [Aplosporella prunicola CBS 121167]|uniref:Uncharacterized protein n=1 Tax=Aplosporella prunicola CBS 121167 TaxID=1176127 RepID=A0A6A6BFQ6_9PEZI|nr:uncharacterized protein K452DRAFT_18085 [Aplosporella prunicola CBS 121167]KAF2142398.1 hypothetical protein K452DRAFT_18085 [Aplosporella prunicola CBS 121167]
MASRGIGVGCWVLWALRRMSNGFVGFVGLGARFRVFRLVSSRLCFVCVCLRCWCCCCWWRRVHAVWVGLLFSRSLAGWLDVAIAQVRLRARVRLRRLKKNEGALLLLLCCYCCCCCCCCC